MSDGKKADHWGVLAVNIGAKSPEELTHEELNHDELNQAVSNPSSEGQIVSGDGGVSAENVADGLTAFVSAPPAYTPPRQQAKQPPKPRASSFGSGWDKLAGDFGLEVPPLPPAIAVEEQAHRAPPYSSPKFEPISRAVPPDELPPSKPLVTEHLDTEHLATEKPVNEESAGEHSLVEADRPERHPRSRTRSRHSARSAKANSDRPTSEERPRHRRDEVARDMPAHAELDPVVFDEDAAEFHDEFVDELGSLSEEFDAARDFEEVEGAGAKSDRSEGDIDKSRPRRRRRRRGRGRSREAGEAEPSSPRAGGQPAERSERAPAGEAGSRRERGRGPAQRGGEGRPAAARQRAPEGRYSETEPIDHEVLEHDFDDLTDDLVAMPGDDIEAVDFDDSIHDDISHDDIGHDDIGHDGAHGHADDDHADEFGDDEGDDDVESPRIGFRNIPTWHEAVGVLVSKNMESRSRNPGGNRGYGGGNRGGRGGRGRGSGRPDKRG